MLNKNKLYRASCLFVIGAEVLSACRGVEHSDAQRQRLICNYQPTVDAIVHELEANTPANTPGTRNYEVNPGDVLVSVANPWQCTISLKAVDPEKRHRHFSLLSGTKDIPGITNFPLAPGTYDLQVIDMWDRCPPEAGLSTGLALQDFKILPGETRVIDLNDFK